MLCGTADLDALAARAPTLERLDAAALALAEVDVVQVLYEIDVAAREALLPPGLHPTNPPLVSWLVWRAAASPVGPFTLAQTRIECRSGVRLRAFLLGSVVDSPAAAAALAAGFGYAVRVGEVRLARQYDAVAVDVRLDGGAVLALDVLDPEPLAPGDVQLVANVNPAHTPRGLRLVQVEPRHEVARAERGRPRLRAFDAGAWGDARVRPLHPVSAAVLRAAVTIPPLRFLCRPDVLAFDGTESIAATT